MLTAEAQDAHLWMLTGLPAACAWALLALGLPGSVIGVFGYEPPAPKQAIALSSTINTGRDNMAHHFSSTLLPFQDASDSSLKKRLGQRMCAPRRNSRFLVLSGTLACSRRG